ncbi:MAG: 30S ribosomal protein S16 [Candidatus Berkelbacteria bacterium Licking1014_7]|uniref:Small ribosomal subunit protein bS16 n=1 Tax=Candidatus Berkelbacteria bacterium Licking1014_7 TaxID=2017147 RepID=A0A554LKP4_9BACT|nr:MAG: 30S ribosomal protein S16 [Candidatus Berkelbacteria bacterium Licking1014_7]
MTIIRLQRVGKKSQPYFRLVVADKKRHVSAKTLEILGSFNPRSKEINFEKEKIISWIEKGAQISNTVARLLQNKIKHNKIKAIPRPPRKPKTKQENQDKSAETKSAQLEPESQPAPEKPKEKLEEKPSKGKPQEQKQKAVLVESA